MRTDRRLVAVLPLALLVLALFCATAEPVLAAARHADQGGIALQPSARPIDKLQLRANARADSESESASVSSSASVAHAGANWWDAWSAAALTPVARNLNVLRQAHSVASGLNNYIAPNQDRITTHYGIKYAQDAWGRVTRASGSAVPGVGTDAVGSIQTFTNAVYYADRQAVRVVANWQAGHIIAASLGGVYFNQIAINFFPQGHASNHGDYKTQEMTAAGLVAVFAPQADCVRLRIDFQYPATAAPVRAPTAAADFYIPTGGTYSIFVKGSCHPGQTIAQAIQAYDLAAKAMPKANPVQVTARANAIRSATNAANFLVGSKATTVWWDANAAGTVKLVNWNNNN